MRIDVAGHGAIDGLAVQRHRAGSAGGCRRTGAGHVGDDLAHGVDACRTGDADSRDGRRVYRHIAVEGSGSAGKDVHFVKIGVEGVERQEAAKQRDHRIDSLVGSQRAVGDLLFLQLR